MIYLLNIITKGFIPICFFILCYFNLNIGSYGFIVFYAAFQVYLFNIDNWKPNLESLELSFDELEIIKKYKLALFFPYGSKIASSFLNGFRWFGLFIFVPLFLFHQMWYSASFIVISFFITGSISVRLDPFFFYGDAVNHGQYQYTNELELLSQTYNKLIEKNMLQNSCINHEINTLNEGNDHTVKSNSKNKVNVSKMDKYCIVCKKKWGKQMRECCTENSVVAIYKRIFNKNKIQYYSLDGVELSKNDIGNMRKNEEIAYKEKLLCREKKAQERLNDMNSIHLTTNKIESSKYCDTSSNEKSSKEINKEPVSIEDFVKLILSVVFQLSETFCNEQVPEFASIMKLDIKNYDPNTIRSKVYAVGLWSASMTLKAEKSIVLSLQNSYFSFFSNEISIELKEFYSYLFSKFDEAWDETLGENQSVLAVTILGEIFYNGKVCKEVMDFYFVALTQDFIFNTMSFVAKTRKSSRILGV